MKDFLPFGLTPSGDFDATLEVGMPDADALIKLSVSGSVAASISGEKALSAVGSLLKEVRAG